MTEIQLKLIQALKMWFFHVAENLCTEMAREILNLGMKNYH